MLWYRCIIRSCYTDYIYLMWNLGQATAQVCSWGYNTKDGKHTYIHIDWRHICCVLQSLFIDITKHKPPITVASHENRCVQMTSSSAVYSRVRVIAKKPPRLPVTGTLTKGSVMRKGFPRHGAIMPDVTSVTTCVIARNITNKLYPINCRFRVPTITW